MYSDAIRTKATPPLFVHITWMMAEKTVAFSDKWRRILGGDVFQTVHTFGR